MIEYVANFYGAEKKPYICKKFVSSSGEESHTALAYANEDERIEMSDELIYEHLDNIVKYIQQRSLDLSVVQLNESTVDHPWPVKNWPDIEWAMNEIILWWNYVYYKSMSTEPQVVYIEHSHSHPEDDHTHDPETGEVVSNSETPSDSNTSHSHDETGEVIPSSDTTEGAQP